MIEPPTDRPDESETIAALRAGDPEVFRMVVTELNPGLVRLASTYVPRSLAEEVVQETWSSVISNLDRFEQRSSLKTWIYRIMLNKVRTLAGRESRIVPFTAMGTAGDDATSWLGLPAERLEAAETLEMINAAIAGLPPVQQEVVQLRDVLGWSAEEVSEALDITSGNQRVLLHRGRVTVRAALTEYLQEAQPTRASATPS